MPRSCRGARWMNRGLQSAIALGIAWYCAVAFAGDPGKPAITAIYPSGDVVPANHLKFYIHFSEPMRQGVFLQHCALLDARRQPVLDPFRETELWSEDRKRLTLWLHPGRQKTGVNLNEEFGPVLRANGSYTLVISGKWPSENGVPLGADFAKTFRATERATAQLDASTWQLKPAPIGSTAPLEVRFPAPLDRALLQRCIRVAGPDGQPVSGTITIAQHERQWSFTPNTPWRATDCHLLADSILEDLAGNSLTRPFEVDLRAAAPKRVPSVVDVPFRPAAPVRETLI